MHPFSEAHVLIVGGGAAGMMAAIAASRSGARVQLLEKTDRLGFKVQIAGGGRCNVTNALDDPRELAAMVPGNGKFMLDAFRRFPPDAIRDLLESHGVRTKVEAPDLKVFPVSDASKDVLMALKTELSACGVAIRYRAAVTEIMRCEGRASGVRLSSGDTLQGDALVVCVGGQSLSRSGSTGDGYELAESVGHHVKPPFPSLVPLRVPGAKPLAGIALRDVEGQALVDGHAHPRRFRGDMLFTHAGLSGPIVLQLSRAICEGLHAGKTAELSFNLKPDATAQELEAEFLRRFEENPRSTLGALLKIDMPKALVESFLAKAGLDPKQQVAELKRRDRQQLVEQFRAWRFPVTGWHSMEAAEVTQGGVDVAEVDPKTFKSRLVPGLYWAGEVLDVDGYVGGFNLQAAWSSGFVAGTSAAAWAQSGRCAVKP